MKKSVKALLLVMCAIVLVVATVFTTLAFLKDETDALTNTFSVGKVDITLKEMNAAGNEVDAGGENNYYKLIPGTEYTKDPFVTVVEGSENSYVFIKVKDNVSTIKDFISEGLVVDEVVWKEYKGDAGLEANEKLYYLEHTATAVDKRYDLYKADKFTLNSDLGSEISSYTGLEIVYTAYAIQKDATIDTVEEAWAEFAQA